METLQNKLIAAADHQSQYLQAIAIGALEDQKHRIASYEVQARFALAAIYDRAVSSAPAPAPKPESKP